MKLMVQRNKIGEVLRSHDGNFPAKAKAPAAFTPYSRCQSLFQGSSRGHTHELKVLHLLGGSGVKSRSLRRNEVMSR
jgi:hypothetical protein